MTNHLSIREIAKRTGLSRNTVRKYPRLDAVEPRFKGPERPSKLDPFVERLTAWLRREMGRPRKQKRTVEQLHADLVMALMSVWGPLPAPGVMIIAASNR